LIVTDDYKLTACAGFIKYFLSRAGVDLLAYIGHRSLTAVPPHRKYGSKTTASFSGGGPTTRLALEGILPQCDDASTKSASDVFAHEDRESSSDEVVEPVNHEQVVMTTD